MALARGSHQDQPAARLASAGVGALLGTRTPEVSMTTAVRETSRPSASLPVLEAGPAVAAQAVGSAPTIDTVASPAAPRATSSHSAAAGTVQTIVPAPSSGGAAALVAPAVPDQAIPSAPALAPPPPPAAPPPSALQPAVPQPIAAHAVVAASSPGVAALALAQNPVSSPTQAGVAAVQTPPIPAGPTARSTPSNQAAEAASDSALPTLASAVPSAAALGASAAPNGHAAYGRPADGQAAHAPVADRPVVTAQLDSGGASSPDAVPSAPPETVLAADPAPEAAPAQRANQDTVTALAAEVARKLDARVTRFEVRLDPAGLGQVQVSLQIRDGGDVSAHLSFERPEAALELRGRANELRTALEQAGFSVGGGALSFDSPGGRQSAPEQPARPTRHVAFAPEADGPPPPPSASRGVRPGVDVRI
jgi:hypothetical protein